MEHFFPTADPIETTEIRPIASHSPNLGMFLVPHEMLESDDGRHILPALFSLCIVLSVSAHESGRGLQYIASSGLFQPLSEGDEVPEYRIEYTFDAPFSNPEYEAQRLNTADGRFGFVAIRKNVLRVPPIPLGTRMRFPGGLN